MSEIDRLRATIIGVEERMNARYKRELYRLESFKLAWGWVSVACLFISVISLILVILNITGVIGA